MRSFSPFLQVFHKSQQKQVSRYCLAVTRSPQLPVQQHLCGAIPLVLASVALWVLLLLKTDLCCSANPFGDPSGSTGRSLCFCSGSCASQRQEGMVGTVGAETSQMQAWWFSSFDFKTWWMSHYTPENSSMRHKLSRNQASVLPLFI